jgi:hypothetical protein
LCGDGDALDLLLHAVRRLSFRLDKPAHRVNVASELHDMSVDLRRSTIRIVSRKAA